MNNLSTMQMLNTAIIHIKQKEVKANYEQRLQRLCDSKEMEAMQGAITDLSVSKNISPEQAAEQLITFITDLQSVWTDFIIMKGTEVLKEKAEEGE